jgi:hypothetical protein
MTHSPIAQRTVCDRTASAMRVGLRLRQRHAHRCGLRGAQHIASISISVSQMLSKGKNLVGEQIRSDAVGGISL